MSIKNKLSNNTGRFTLRTMISMMDLYNFYQCDIITLTSFTIIIINNKTRLFKD